jgi:hypothetical protein
MPLVFVHGVNVREGTKPEEKKQFKEGIDARDHLFRAISMAAVVPPPAHLHIENPYWGEHASRFTYDLVSVPTSDVETFGPTDETLAQVLRETVPLDVAMKIQKTAGAETMLLVTLARDHSIVHAVDVIVAAAAVRGATDNEPRKNEELALFAAKAMAFAESHPDTSWLEAKDPATGEARLKSDSDFLEELTRRVKGADVQTTGVETFGSGGILDRLKSAAQGLANVAKKTLKAAVGAVAGAAVGAVVGGGPEALVRSLRPTATRRAGIFLGDVFTYLAKRGSAERPGDIVSVVTKALDDAQSLKTVQDSRLIVIAHSMGGNIVYDILTHYRVGFEVDLLVTVGSQVGLFKELRLYMEDTGSGPNNPHPQRIGKPAKVGTWLNIFDPVDFLGFAAEGVFDNVKDFAFSNQVGPLDAHSLYFYRPLFHERLRARLLEVGFGVAV